jgi:hypothetical protein
MKIETVDLVWEAGRLAGESEALQREAKAHAARVKDWFARYQQLEGSADGTEARNVVADVVAIVGVPDAPLTPEELEARVARARRRMSQTADGQWIQ